jgi:BTB/POZ domain-containing protein 13
MLSNGNWLESSQTVITIAIPDENINDYSLDIAFGSLYKDDVTIIPNSVVNVLATASLFNLYTLIEECESIMLENLNYKTVVHYYYASQTYGLKGLLAKTFDWLCMNIMRMNDDVVLCDLSLALFRDIVESNKLVVIQVETDLYTLCKRWLYYQMQTGYKQEIAKNWQKVANDYFKFYIEQQRLDYLLECEHMHKYHCIFKTIRFNHILSDLSSLRLIKTDRIIPTHW